MRNIVVFDYDGTLHETMRIYKPAIEETLLWLRDICHQAVSIPSDARISSWLGMTTADMWHDFMPELDPQLRQEAGRRVGAHMLNGLEKGLAGWYSGVEQLLDKLKADEYELLVLSNCGNAYARSHWDCFRMDRWFTAFFASETWHDIPKAGILQEIVSDYEGALRKTPVKCGETAEAREACHPSRSCVIRAVVGDRASDLAAAQAVGVPFFGCLYGYGSPEELANATALAASPQELYSLIRSCSH